MEREVFDDLWDKADREYRSQGNNSFTFKHHLFAVLDDKLKVQPKLRIPKKIAEQADKTDFYLIFREGQEEFYQWFDHEHDEYKEVIYAYLAGRAIGVELVEVTDD